MDLQGQEVFRMLLEVQQCPYGRASVRWLALAEGPKAALEQT